MKRNLSNSSYEEYMKDQLMLLSSKFAIKSYKRADLGNWFLFERGKDIRVQIQWKKNSVHEFIVEKEFWYMKNTNKEDRQYMRMLADPKISMFKNALFKKEKK
tara:strand:- start:1462 stop:1770 length:309 start_codon:yes stop_codon:yes gene_type:complete